MPAATRLFVLCCLFTLACAAAPPPASAPAPARINGQVIKLTGDFMPGPKKPSGKRTPLAVPVHVFRGKVKPHATLDPTHPQLVATVQSDATGRFSVDLDTDGVYTLVAEIDGALYLNHYDGDGYWWSTTVVAGTTATVTIEDNSDATY